MRPDKVEDFDATVRHLRRRSAASRAAYAMHEKYPDAARENGQKGGEARAKQIGDPGALGRWLARRRWYGELAGPAPP